VPGSWTYLPVKDPGAMQATAGAGDREFPFSLWLVPSLFVDSERALLLAGYGTPGCHLGSSDLPFSG
jgi:hypothetical protein